MDVKKFYSICLQGSVLEAVEYLKSFKDKNEEVLELERKYEERFFSSDPSYEIDSDDPWVRQVVSCYFSYFRSVLTGNPSEEAEKRLAASLSKLTSVDENADLDEIESALENAFKEKGYSFLGGVTMPYRGPYIWKTTKKKDFHVSLPDCEEKVSVYFLSDFLMLSWAHFATMGKHYTGGWAMPEGLYYVNYEKKEIDTDSMKFQVWFLKHEAQHLSDYKKYPNMNGRNFEYRAKLVELIYNSDPNDLIEKFMLDAKDDKSLPHPYAAFSIIKGLSRLIFDEEHVSDKEQWRSVEPGRISKESLKLFLKNNEDLQKAGSETEGII